MTRPIYTQRGADPVGDRPRAAAPVAGEEHLRVIALTRTQEGGSSLRQACTNMNGTRVDVHVGDMQAFLAKGGLRRGSDVLLLDVDLRDPNERERLTQIVQRVGTEIPVILTAPDPALDDIRVSIVRNVLPHLGN